MKNTYVKCADWTWEEKLLYINKCLGCDIPHDKLCGNACKTKDEILNLYKSDAVFLYCSDNGMISYDDRLDAVSFIGKSEVKLSSLKPKQEKQKRVKVSYVKVEDSIFDLRPDFEAGELFVKIGDNYEVVLSAQCLTTLLAVGSCYRRIETKIDWRDEVKGKYSLVDFRNTDDDGCHNLGDWTPEGFVKLCHFVAEITGKPTN